MLMILGLNPEKQTVSQMGPVGTSQKSSDDEVSEFVIPSNKRMISEMKMCESPFTFSSKNAYIACVKRLSI